MPHLSQLEAPATLPSGCSHRRSSGRCRLSVRLLPRHTGLHRRRRVDAPVGLISCIIPARPRRAARRGPLAGALEALSLGPCDRAPGARCMDPFASARVVDGLPLALGVFYPTTVPARGAAFHATQFPSGRGGRHVLDPHARDARHGPRAPRWIRLLRRLCPYDWAPRNERLPDWLRLSCRPRWRDRRRYAMTAVGRSPLCGRFSCALFSLHDVGKWGPSSGVSCSVSSLPRERRILRAARERSEPLGSLSSATGLDDGRVAAPMRLLEELHSPRSWSTPGTAIHATRGPITTPGLV